jgi:hypothetical protein
MQDIWIRGTLTLPFGILSTVRSSTIASKRRSHGLGVALVLSNEGTLDDGGAIGVLAKRDFGNNLGFSDNSTAVHAGLCAVVVAKVGRLAASGWSLGFWTTDRTDASFSDARCWSIFERLEAGWSRPSNGSHDDEAVS